MGAQASSHHRQAPPRCNSELVTSKDLILPADRLQQLTTRLFAADRRDAWRDTRTVATVATVGGGGGRSSKEAGSTGPAPWSYVLQASPLLSSSSASSSSSSSSGGRQLSSRLRQLDPWRRRRDVESALPGGAPPLSSSEQLELLLSGPLA